MDYSLLTLALLAVLALSVFAQVRVKSVFARNNRRTSVRQIRAADAAVRMLRENGAAAQVQPVRGRLTDHYNPRTGIVGLSEEVYGSDSVAALAIAAHEVGHVLQYEEGYFAIRVRNVLLPVVNIGSQFGPFLAVIGLLLGATSGYGFWYYVSSFGLFLYFFLLIFQLITLPVEFNASRRALELLTEGGYLVEEEVPAAKQVLRNAAWTYVLSALAALLSVLRLTVLVRGGRRRR